MALTTPHEIFAPEILSLSESLSQEFGSSFKGSVHISNYINFDFKMKKEMFSQGSSLLSCQALARGRSIPPSYIWKIRRNKSKEVIFLIASIPLAAPSITEICNIMTIMR